jgi:hypothetical protein
LKERYLGFSFAGVKIELEEIIRLEKKKDMKNPTNPRLATSKLVIWVGYGT